jgi:xanthine dehydrogenase accessory factor
VIRGPLADQAARLTAERKPFALATVVRARRPTSVRPGDAAIIDGDGTISGFVGGVCAESSVRLHALRAMEIGEPILLRLVPDDADEINEETDAVVERNPCLSGGALEIFLEPQLPSPRIVVAGHQPIALAVRALAVAAGYEVDDVLQPGDAAVIVASHGSSEEGLLGEALRAGVPYVALVASPKRGEAVRGALEVPDELKARLHTPAGLDLGARTPSEIAVAILAELVSEQHAQPGGRVHAAIDPVCGMKVAVSDATPSEAGEYFCSEHCRAAYAAQHALP